MIVICEGNTQRCDFCDSCIDVAEKLQTTIDTMAYPPKMTQCPNCGADFTIEPDYTMEETHDGIEPTEKR